MFDSRPGDAARELIKFREDYGYVSPCEADPRAWDAPNPHVEDALGAAFRLALSASACTGCMCFNLCADFRDEMGEGVLGVLAGETIFDSDYPAFNEEVRSVMEGGSGVFYTLSAQPVGLASVPLTVSYL